MFRKLGKRVVALEEQVQELQKKATIEFSIKIKVDRTIDVTQLSDKLLHILKLAKAYT